MELLKNTTDRRGARRKVLTGPERCWKWFTKFFPRGFKDAKYIDWERNYKLRAHEEWQEALNQRDFRKLLKGGRHQEVGATAVRIESRTNILFSFEKMALRDAVRSNEGAGIFAEGLYDVVHGRAGLPARFDRWCDAVARLPRKQTRVLTHPVVTVFPFIADPANYIFLKPNVTKDAASRYGFDFRYESRPSWEVYSQLLRFAEMITSEFKAKGPRDMIDIQSFIWVIGSEEYRNMAA